MGKNMINSEDLNSIFPLFDDLYADMTNGLNANDFKAKIEKARLDLEADKSILKDNGVCMEYDNMTEVPEGRFTVMRGG